MLMIVGDNVDNAHGVPPCRVGDLFMLAIKALTLKCINPGQPVLTRKTRSAIGFV